MVATINRIRLLRPQDKRTDICNASNTEDIEIISSLRPIGLHSQFKACLSYRDPVSKKKQNKTNPPYRKQGKVQVR